MEKSINERIAMLCEHAYQGKVQPFAKKCNIATGTLRDIIKKGTQPGSTVLMSILTAFPDISAEWLMRGGGSMLKPSTGHVNNIDLSIGKTTGSSSPSVIGDNNAIASGAHSSVVASDDIIRQLLAQNQQLISLITNNNKQ